jgi:hypothetical protein
MQQSLIADNFWLSYLYFSNLGSISENFLFKEIYILLS